MILKIDPVWTAPDGGAGGGEAPAAEAPSPESVLFPSESGGTGEDKGDSAADSVEKNATDDSEKKEGDDKDKADPLDVVPEDGKYQLKMPDGVEEDEELSAALGSDFKELGLTHKQAQKLVDKYVAVQQERQQKQAEAWSQTVVKWADEAKADQEIGGANWDSTVTNARRAVDRLGTPALKEYFDVTGGGNHPEIIRFMAKVGAMIREDNPANGGAEGAGKPAEAAHRLFPNDVPKGK